MNFKDLKKEFKDIETTCPECGSRNGIELSETRIKFDCGDCEFITSLDIKKPVNKRFLKFLQQNLGEDKAAFYDWQLQFQAHEDYYWIQSRDGGMIPKFYERKLPKLARPITPEDSQHWNYLIGRGISEPEIFNFYVAPDDISENEMHNRVILPWRDMESKTVGWNARHIAGGEPRFISKYPKRAVWGLDIAAKGSGNLIVCEGEFDAMQVQGVAVGCNNIHKDQAAQLDAVDRYKVVVPDNDSSSKRLEHAAHRYGWGLAWVPPEYKDISEACLALGKDAVRKLIDDKIASDIPNVL